MKYLFAVAVLLVSLASFAQNPPKARHALAKVAKLATMPVVHPKLFSKATLGTALFATENVVDVLHLSLDGADKAFDAISIKGKVPVIDSIYAFVGAADKDTGKLDSWLERQERYLFGTSN